MKIGYIITDSLHIPECFEKTSFPFEGGLTLIVGWKKAKEFFPDMSLRNWKINDNVYWTLEAIDDKMKMENDIESFKNLCVERVISEYKFIYLDILLNPAPVLDLSCSDKILLTNSIIYIRNLKSIISISLELSISVGFDVMSHLPSNISVHTVKENKFDVDNRFLLCFL